MGKLPPMELMDVLRVIQAQREIIALQRLLKAASAAPATAPTPLVTETGPVDPSRRKMHRTSSTALLDAVKAITLSPRHDDGKTSMLSVLRAGPEHDSGSTEQSLVAALREGPVGRSKRKPGEDHDDGDEEADFLDMLRVDPTKATRRHGSHAAEVSQSETVSILDMEGIQMTPESPMPPPASAERRQRFLPVQLDPVLLTSPVVAGESSAARTPEEYKARIDEWTKIKTGLSPVANAVIEPYANNDSDLTDLFMRTIKILQRRLLTFKKTANLTGDLLLSQLQAEKKLCERELRDLENAEKTSERVDAIIKALGAVKDPLEVPLENRFVKLKHDGTEESCVIS